MLESPMQNAEYQSLQRRVPESRLRNAEIEGRRLSFSSSVHSAESLQTLLCGVQSLQWRVLSASMRSAEYRMQSSKCQNLQCRVLSAES